MARKVLVYGFLVIVLIASIEGSWVSTCLFALYWLSVSIASFRDNRRMLNWLMPSFDVDKYNRLRLRQAKFSLVFGLFILAGILQLVGVW